MSCKKRTLKQVDTPSGAVQVEQRLCIKGGHVDSWCVLPIEQILGVQAVKITTGNEPWLNQVILGSSTPSSSSKAIMSQVIHELRCLVNREYDATCKDSISVPEILDHCQNKAIAAGDSDDDDDVKSDAKPADNGDDATSQHADCMSGKCDRWFNITHKDGVLSVCITSHKGVLYVRAEAKQLEAFLSMCFDACHLTNQMNGRVLFLPGMSTGGFVPEAMPYILDEPCVDNMLTTII
jgi:hypothetical protein